MSAAFSPLSQISRRLTTDFILLIVCCFSPSCTLSSVEGMDFVEHLLTEDVGLDVAKVTDMGGYEMSFIGLV